MSGSSESVLPGRTSLLGACGYAYSTLSETEKRAYLRLVGAISERGKIRLADYPGLEAKDVSRLLACIDMDHPELFWMDGYQSFWARNSALGELMSDEGMSDEIMDAFVEGTDFDGDGRISFMERRLAAGRTALQANPLLAWSIDDELSLSPLWFGWRIDRIKRQLDGYVSECARTIPADADDFLVLRRVFEFVVRHTTYELADARKSQDVRSVMVSHRSVCKGYAEAFQYLLLSFGVPCFTVQGLAGATEERMGAHAWNYVLIDGVWNRVDVTAADWDLAENPQRAPFVPLELRALFVDYSCMCRSAGLYRPAAFIAYPEAGTTSDYFKHEGYEICEKRFLDYARVVLRLYKREEPYVLVRFPSDPTADYDYLMRAIDFAKRFCLAANFDEAAFDDLEGCVERMNSLSREAFEASPIYDFGLQTYVFPAKPNMCLVTAVGRDGESEGA